MDGDEQRAALFRLLLIVGAGILAAVATGVGRTVAVVVAIVVMIMLHELGHFLTAKWGGMKVTEYFLGFGPRLWSVRKGETEYGVKAIPAGGYVKILGMSNLEQVEPADEARTYRQQSYGRRFAVGVAGSAMHFLIAFVLLVVLYSAVGQLDARHPRLQVGELTLFKTGQSPAQAAGFHLGDKIVSVDGRRFARWDDLPPYIQAHPGQPLTFVVERGGRQLTLTPTPVDRRSIELRSGADPGRPSEPTGFIGIGPAFPVLRTSPVTALGRAGGELGRQMGATLGALGRLVTLNGIKGYGDQLTGNGGGSGGRAATPGKDEPRFLSPVGFVRVASQAANSGLRDVLYLLVLINIFVGVFNLLPLLPLDGGHVAIATYERIRSRRGRRYHADVAKLMPLTYGVFLLLVFLGLSSLYLDIVRPLANPFQ
jgi:membrane-associated protease RseP (regulator of RpoE activity)